jgi:hypothetical protein
MTPAADGFPLEGSSHRTLGILSPGDVMPDADGRVAWGGGGLSAAPCTMWKLPNHRRPRSLGRGSTGNDKDHVFSLRFEDVRAVDLAIRADPMSPTKHALIEPIGSMPLNEYRDAVRRTRGDWKKVWP